jgi:nicotinate-nucleotide pyrophosphorylase (carboxylating)
VKSIWNDFETEQAVRLLTWGLHEDLGQQGDITSASVIDPDRKSSPKVVARHNGVVAGVEAIRLLSQIEPFEILFQVDDGPVHQGDTIARLAGPTRTLLSIERTMLNFLCHLSGIATMTARFVEAVRGTNATICDTRKTTPGWRYLEKYAVRVGGGTNHRVGLFDAVLIKDNHLAELSRQFERPWQVAIERARHQVPRGTIVEIEIDSLAPLDEALPSQPDIVLLDNMSLQEMAEAVAIRNKIAPLVLLEASGGVNMTTVRAIAETGVDRISVGAITHSAPILDLALDDLLP